MIYNSWSKFNSLFSDELLFVPSIIKRQKVSPLKLCVGVRARFPETCLRSDVITCPSMRIKLFYCYHHIGMSCGLATNARILSILWKLQSSTVSLKRIEELSRVSRPEGRADREITLKTSDRLTFLEQWPYPINIGVGSVLQEIWSAMQCGSKANAFHSKTFTERRSLNKCTSEYITGNWYCLRNNFNFIPGCSNNRQPLTVV